MPNHLSLSIFAQKYLCKCEGTYFALQNKYLHIYEDGFGTKILRDDCALSSFRGIQLLSFTQYRKEDKIDKVTLNKDFMTSTEKSNGQQQIVQHKLIPKSSKNNNNSIKKDDLTDPDEDEQFNEVLDDRISENDNNGDNIDNMLKDNDTIAGNITSNEEFNESSNQHQPTQRAKRDINFNYIGIIKAARSSQNLSNYSFIYLLRTVL